MSFMRIFLPFLSQPGATMFALSKRNIHRPGLAIFEVEVILIIASLFDSGMLKYVVPSPALKPACLVRSKKATLKHGETMLNKDVATFYLLSLELYPLHPNISMHILYTDLHTFPKV